MCYLLKAAFNFGLLKGATARLNDKKLASLMVESVEYLLVSFSVRANAIYHLAVGDVNC